MAAVTLGDADLGNRLHELSASLTDLVGDPSNGVFKSEALVGLDSILSLLANDPIFAAFVDPLTVARGELSAATLPADIQTAVTDLGAALNNFAAATDALSRGNFDIYLSPSSQAAQPLVPKDFSITVQNVGTETTTYDLAVSGLPADVTSQLSDSFVTLDPGQFTNVTLTLTQTTDTELLAFDFSVDVSIDGTSPAVTKSAVGSLRSRNDFVSVTGVTLDRPFASPGDPVGIRAQLLNAVNRQQDAEVTYSVLDSNNTPVLTLLTPVPVTLNVQTSLADVNLGTLDTSGFELGQYTIQVTVTDTSGNALPARPPRPRC